MLVCSSSHYSVQYFRYFVKSTHFSERLKFIMLEKDILYCGKLFQALTTSNAK